MSGIRPIDQEPSHRPTGWHEEERAAIVSFLVEVPQPLQEAMTAFIEAHPNWDQYRLIQASLAGFLVQNGVQDRGVTRCFLANLFPAAGRFAPLAAPQPKPEPRPAAGQLRHRRQPFHPAA